MEVKEWKNNDEPQTTSQKAKEGEYVHVWGRLKDFNGRRHVISHVIRPVTDFNEINYHLLEATAVHLYFTRGPPESLKEKGLFVKNEGGNDNGTTANGAAGTEGRPLPARLSQNARKVFHVLNSEPQSNEGLHVHQIAQKTGMTGEDVFRAGDDLLQEGLIYTTVDDETWAIMDM